MGSIVLYWAELGFAGLYLAVVRCSGVYLAVLGYTVLHWLQNAVLDTEGGH